MEDYLRKAKGGRGKEEFCNKWDYKIEGIEGVAIGGGWVAVATKVDIRIFDFGGNEITVISFDRNFLSMCAYEDQLVIAYSASLPLASSHLFELKSYKITLQSFKL